MPSRRSRRRTGLSPVNNRKNTGGRLYRHTWLGWVRPARFVALIAAHTASKSVPEIIYIPSGYLSTLIIADWRYSPRRGCRIIPRSPLCPFGAPHDDPERKGHSVPCPPSAQGRL